METRSAKITFCSGVGKVTGANFLLETGGRKVLVDCGLVQGSKLAEEENWKPFPYDPKEINALFITHAHIDHIGRIPKLIHDGFRGDIFSTQPTRDLSLPMLEDTAEILSKSRRPGAEDIYSAHNIIRAFWRWTSFDYRAKFPAAEGLSAEFFDAGHILGSAMILFECGDTKILFTGDLGNSPSPLLPDTEKVEGVGHMVMESVYGDRNHESREDRKALLARHVKENFQRKGVLLIPVFSLERTQELLFELNGLVESGAVPVQSIFLDSPLAIRLTEIFVRHKERFNARVREVMSKDDELFDFPGLRTTLLPEDSRMIPGTPNPKIIIAGSGMSSGGRIVHHEREYLPDPNNTILLTGYQTPGTPGRFIQDGAKKVRIGRDEVPVRARVVSIFGYSGHKDSDHLVSFVREMGGSLRRVFLAMGEPSSSMFLAQRIRQELGISAQVPSLGDSVYIDL